MGPGIYSINTFHLRYAFSGLDAGQGQVGKADGSAQMTDNAGLQAAVKEHSEAEGGVNTGTSEVLMTSYCH